MHTRQYKHPGHELQCTANCAWSMHKMSQNAPPACGRLWQRTWDCPRTCIPCVRTADCLANTTTRTTRVAVWFWWPPQCRRAHWSQCRKDANRSCWRDKKRGKTWWVAGLMRWADEIIGIHAHIFNSFYRISHHKWSMTRSVFNCHNPSNWGGTLKFEYSWVNLTMPCFAMKCNWRIIHTNTILLWFQDTLYL